MPPTDAQRVRHILDAIGKVEARVAGLDEPAFVANEVVHDSVLYQLAVLGAAANRLSEAVRERHPEIPWPQIVAFRNRVMHEYHSVSLRIVWQTIEQNLPVLQSAMEQELTFVSSASAKRT
jgi:uncharacterized protein with HEPN domain